MKLENEEDLDHLVICPKCYTLHEEVPVENGMKALCRACGTVLYRYDVKLIDYGLSLSLSGLIFFILANLFPLLRIEILGHEQFITLPKTFISLFDNGFYAVGLLCTFLIFIFPLMIFVLNLVLFLLLKLKKGYHFSRELLILLSYIKPWNMSDIFFISILVALVKLIGYAQIYMGASFWTLIIFVLIDLYINKRIQLSEIWMLRKRIFALKGIK